MSSIIIKPNPLSSGTPVAADLAAITGEDQGTVAAKLDAQIRQEQEDMMMDPGAYANVNDPFTIVKTAAEKVKFDLANPEKSDSDEEKPTTTDQAEGADLFSADMNNLEDATQWANEQFPMPDQQPSEGTPDAGAVNGDSDITNQSLDMINSIEPTPEQPGPEVDLVSDGEGPASDEEVPDDIKNDPTFVLGDEI